jgi:glycosyltransferase involved in cell wall biosynthesis
VCANGDALKRIREFLGDHAMELPIGIDERRFNTDGPTIRRKLGWKNDDLVIGYVGRLTHLKGVDLLAAAFCEISRIVPKVKLLVVGSGPEEKFMRATLAQEIECRKAHIEPDVSHESLGEWYRAMNLFVMPSRYENFSNSMLEAMSCGIPFVASDVGGNKMLAEKGSGWLFEAGSVASLLACLRAILNDAENLQARGRVGCRYIRSLYNWDASAERLEEILTSRLGVTWR